MLLPQYESKTDTMYLTDDAHRRRMEEQQKPEANRKPESQKTHFNNFFCYMNQPNTNVTREQLASISEQLSAVQIVSSLTHHLRGNSLLVHFLPINKSGSTFLR